MPSRIMKKRGMPVASGLFVANTWKVYSMTFTEKTHTTTFLYCRKSTTGMKVRRLKRVEVILFVGASL